MGLIKGGFLRLSQTFLYLLAFLCSALIVGIYRQVSSIPSIHLSANSQLSYFLAVQADRNVKIATYEKAVEGISAIAVLFTLFAIVLTCCLGGMFFYSRWLPLPLSNCR